MLSLNLVRFLVPMFVVTITEAALDYTKTRDPCIIQCIFPEESPVLLNSPGQLRQPALCVTGESVHGASSDSAHLHLDADLHAK